MAAEGGGRVCKVEETMSCSSRPVCVSGGVLEKRRRGRDGECARLQQPRLGAELQDAKTGSCLTLSRAVLAKTERKSCSNYWLMSCSPSLPPLPPSQTHHRNARFSNVSRWLSPLLGFRDHSALRRNRQCATLPWPDSALFGVSQPN